MITTRPWDPSEYLNTEEDMAAYLEAALEENDPILIAAVRDDLARARRRIADTLNTPGIDAPNSLRIQRPEGT